MSKCFILVFTLLFGYTSSLFADWKIEYSNSIIKFTGGAKQRGSFPSKSACENARDSSSRASGDYSNLMRNSRCVGSDSGSSGGSGGGYSGKYALQYTVMQTLLQGFMEGMEREQKAAAAREKKEKEEAALRKIQEEQRKQMSREEWEALKKQEAKIKAAAEKQRTQESNALLAKMQTASGNHGLQAPSSSPLKLSSIASTGRIDTSMMKSTDRLRCSAYFSDLAKKAKTPEKAHYYNQQADALMSGRMIEEPCGASTSYAIPEASPPQTVISEEDFLIIKRNNMMEMISQNLKGLESIEAKERDNEIQLEAIQEKKVEAQKTIQTVQKEIATTQEPQKKQELDDLLANAESLLEEATQEEQKAKATKEELFNEKNALEEELKNLHDTIKTSSSENKGNKQ